MLPEFLCLFGGEIFLFMGMQMLFHVFYDMFGILVIVHLKVRRNFCHLECMAAFRAELPFLEPVHIRECPASRAFDDQVHL